MIIVFIDVGIVGIICLFIAAMIGSEVSSVFDVLPNYINKIALVLVVLQLIKMFLFTLTGDNKLDIKAKIAVLFASFFDGFRCLIISITICNWLASYSSDNLFEMIFNAVTFMIDVCIYGLIFIMSEAIAFTQGNILKEGSGVGYLIVGIINTVLLFVVIAFLSQGALVRAFERWFMSFG